MLLSLPVELLNQILEELEDESLYNLGCLCHTLNHVALTALFQRHAPRFFEGNLVLSYYTPYVIPALRNALFLSNKDLNTVQISFGHPERLLPELRLLSDIIGSLKSLQSLNLTLTLAAFPPPRKGRHGGSGIDPTVFTTTLRQLLNVAVERECSSLFVSSQCGLDHLAKTFKPAKASKERPRRNDLVAPTSGPLQKLLGRLKLPKLPRAEVKLDMNNASNLARPEVRPVNEVPALPKIYPTVPNLTSFVIGAELFFEPAWIDWTLHICNTAPLTRLRFHVFNFKSCPHWDDHLLKFRLVYLKSFFFEGDELKLDNLYDFLQHNSSLLDELELNIATLTSINGTKVVFNFPKLTKLTISPGLARWFFNTASKAAENATLPLPNLRAISFIPPIQPGSSLIAYHSDLTDALTALAALVTVVKSSRLYGDFMKIPVQQENQAIWLSEIMIMCRTLPQLVSWLKSHLLDPSPNDDTEFGPRPTPSQITALTCVQRLTLRTSGSTLDDAEFLNVLPSFLGLFPQLKILTLPHMHLDQAMHLSRTGYWKKVKNLCLPLEKCQFSRGPGLSMENLITRD